MIKLKYIYLKALKESAPKAPSRDSEEGPGYGDEMDKFQRGAYDIGYTGTKRTSSNMPQAPQAPNGTSSQTGAAHGVVDLSAVEKYYATLALRHFKQHSMFDVSKGGMRYNPEDLVSKLEGPMRLNQDQKKILSFALMDFVQKQYGGKIPKPIGSLLSKL